ncbi:MAG: Flp pilus assembly protein CpaB [Pirellula sp.]|jgi:pilus assembly protein CpaB
MRTKSLVLLIVALGCGVVASVAVSQVMLEQKPGEALPTVGVMVTSKDVSPMTKLSAEMFSIEQWPVDRAPLGALNDPKQIEGKYAKQRLYRGEPILEAKLSLRGKDLVVPEGYRIFDLPVHDSNGGSGYLGPGDRVDVIGFFEKGTRFPISKSVRVMQNVEIAMVDGVAFRDPEASPKKANTVQLLVQERQYEALDTASNLGKLKLSLRAPDADPTVIPVPDNGDNFLTWLKDNEEKEKPAPAPSVVDAVQPIETLPVAKARNEMVVVSPKDVAVYRWVEGRRLPIKIETSGLDEEGVQGYTGTPANNGWSNGPSNAGQQPSPFAANPAISNPQTPVDPAAMQQPSLIWDPTTGTWQSGGFKPVYPVGK